MNRYYYDLHLHSCLSPCGSDEMTPATIAGMATLAGLNIVALTDHNSTKNCPAFFRAAKAYGLIPVAGMELTTAEEIHLVCLFETLDAAMAFGAAVDERRVKFPNRPDIFGNQLVMNTDDEVLEEEPCLLPNATTLSLEEGAALAESFGGIAYPAHIDRPSGGILAILGSFPEKPAFRCFEVRDPEKLPELTEANPILKNLLPVVSSDAHYLDQIPDAAHFFELEDEPYSGDFVRHMLFEKLRNT